MADEKEALNHFHSLLEQLVVMPLNVQGDTKPWDDACARIPKELAGKFPGFELEPYLRALVEIPADSPGLAVRQQQHGVIYEYLVRARRNSKGGAQEDSVYYSRFIAAIALCVVSFFSALPISMKMGHNENDWLGLGIIVRAGFIFIFGCFLAWIFLRLTGEKSE